MLTPGIEYFGAVDDAAAQEFVDGNARSAPPLVRADGVGPDVPMSIFGALLTGRSIEELAAEPQLVHLSVESRGEAEIHLFRLPSATARALADADAEQLADVARRSLVYAELAGASPELITGFLAELGDCVRRGRGDLYARIIAPSAPPRVPRLVPALRRALPWVGVGFAGASIAFAVTIPVGLTPLLAVAGLTLSFSVGALLTRRGARRAFDRGQGTRGSIVVRVDADARLLGVLPGILSEVLGDLKLPPPPRRGELHLRADPTGSPWSSSPAACTSPAIGCSGSAPGTPRRPGPGSRAEAGSRHWWWFCGSMTTNRCCASCLCSTCRAGDHRTGRSS